jgi:hypothetical protein
MNDNISIKSYLCNYDNSYILIEDVEDNEKLADPKYIEGAIEIKINDKIVLPIEYWDDVDVLWHYIIHHLKEIDEGKDEVTFRFPDHALCILTFKTNKNHSIINVQFKATKPMTEEIIEQNKATVEYKDFMLCVISSCKIFFNKIFLLEPKLEKNYKFLRQNLSFLENKYKNKS